MVGRFFVLGLTLGWGPCLSYCGLLLTPYLLATKLTWQQGLKSTLNFCLGRMLASLILGVLAALSAKFLSLVIQQPKVISIFQILAGGLVALLGLVVLTGKSGGLKFCRFLPKKDHLSLFWLGFFTELAPCAPLLAVATYLMVYSRNIWQGAVNGLAFGLGTTISPLLVLGALAGFLPRRMLNAPKLYLWLQRGCGLLLVILGLFLIGQKINGLGY